MSAGSESAASWPAPRALRGVARLLEGPARRDLLEGAFELAGTPTAVADLDGRMLAANRAFRELTGRTPEQLASARLAELATADVPDEEVVRFARLGVGAQRFYRSALTFRRPDGTAQRVGVDVRLVLTAQGAPWHVVVEAHPLDHHGALHMARAARRPAPASELVHRATHDALTGLANRPLFIDHLALALARLGRRTERVGVLFLDLDRFKLVNDSFGHAAGDELLITAAQRLRELLRPEDTVGRFGGDEFAMLCEGLTCPADAVVIAQRVLESLSRPVQLRGREVVVTPSIGIALSRGPHTRPEELVSDADTAMYRAKSLGGARHERYDAALRARASERVDLEAQLRRCVTSGELRLSYQPTIALAQRDVVVGAEALVRWERPGHGLVPPRTFIPTAEETGAILEIGGWVLDTACRAAVTWSPRGAGESRPSVSVNVSARQLAEDDFADRVARALDDTGLEPSRLCLELTESALMDHHDAAQVRAVSAAGVRVAIDDFGTGYSSLDRLGRLPVDQLKIDRSFVGAMSTNREGFAVVTAIVELAHAFGIPAVAEGVETVEQEAALVALGCDLAQGFLFSEPVPPVELDEWLHTAAVPWTAAPLATEAGVTRRG